MRVDRDGRVGTAPLDFAAGQQPCLGAELDGRRIPPGRTDDKRGIARIDRDDGHGRIFVGRFIDDRAAGLRRTAGCPGARRNPDDHAELIQPNKLYRIESGHVKLQRDKARPHFGALDRNVRPYRRIVRSKALFQ
ncbi:MAG: hypothetical protein IPP87_22160 [Ideonella sp.]|nr:hypothetical protein [Ideonella sp.]